VRESTPSVALVRKSAGEYTFYSPFEHQKMGGQAKSSSTGKPRTTVNTKDSITELEQMIRFA